MALSIQPNAMSAPALPDRSAASASTSPIAPPVPSPVFLGESREAVNSARFPKEELSSKPQQRPLKGETLAAAERLMLQMLVFRVNGEEILKTVEHTLQCYKRGYERCGYALRSAKLIGSHCPKIPGSRGIGAWLGESSSFPEKTHIETQVSDVDFMIDMRRDSATVSDPLDVVPDLLRSIEVDYWWERASFKVQFLNGGVRTCRGFKELVALFAENPTRSNPENWGSIHNIRTVKGPDLDEKIFPPQLLKDLIQNTSPLREDPTLDQLCFLTHAVQSFEQLYGKPLREFIKKVAFDDWHFLQQFQRHRMSCRDQDGMAYDFTAHLTGEDIPPRMVFQELSINYAAWLNGSRELMLEGSDKALAHKFCKMKLWTEKQKIPRDYFYSQWINTLGYRDIDTASEEFRLIMARFCSQTPQLILMLADMIDQELLARKCVEPKPRKEWKTNQYEEELAQKVQKLVAGDPKHAQAFSNMLDEELGSVIPSSEVTVQSLLRNIHFLRTKSRYFEEEIHNLLDFQLHPGLATDRKRNREIDPGRAIAFLINVCADLPPECNQRDLFRLWFYLTPLIPTLTKPDSFYTFVHQALLKRTLTPKQISAALGALSFDALSTSLDVRLNSYLQPIIAHQGGKYAIHLLIEGQTLQMPLDPAAALETLCSADVSCDKSLKTLFDFAKPADPCKIDADSPLVQQEKVLNIDYKALCQAALKGAENQNPAIRRISHQLLIRSLGFELPEAVWRQVIAALPQIFHLEILVEERAHLSEALIQRLNGRYGQPVMVQLTDRIRDLARRASSPQELKRRLILAMSQVRMEPFPSITVEAWRELPHSEKMALTLELYESSKTTLTAQVFEIARWMIEELPGTGENAAKRLDELGKLVMQNPPKAQKWQAIYDFVDLLVAFSHQHQDPPVSSLVIGLLNHCYAQNPAGDHASAFASACESKGLMPQGPLAAAAKLMRSNRLNVDQLSPVFAALGSLMVESKDSNLTAVALNTCEFFLKRWPSENEAEKRAQCEEWVRQAVRHRGDLVEGLFDRLSLLKVFGQDRQSAILLLDSCRDCCKEGNYDQSVALFRFAVEKRYWQPDDFSQNFDAFLEFYKIVRVARREVSLELRGDLLKARPDHPELNEEIRRRKLHELERVLKIQISLTEQISSFRSLLDQADSKNEKEQASVIKFANRLVPQMDPLEQVDLLEILHHQYPQIDLEHALARFPVEKASAAQLKIFARLIPKPPEGDHLPPAADSAAKKTVEALLGLREYSAALELLRRMQLSDDSLWNACLQTVADHSHAHLAEAWEVGLTRKKWARFSRNPKGGSQVCLNWFSFDAVQFQLLLALLGSGNREKDWKGLIIARLKVAQDPQDIHNRQYPDIGFMRMRLLKYLELLLPSSMPHRYTRLFDELSQLREAITPGLLQGVDPSPLPDLDERRVKCALRSGNHRTLLNGLKLLETLMKGGAALDEWVLVAAREVTPFVRQEALIQFLSSLIQSHGPSLKNLPEVLDILLNSRKPRLMEIALEIACQLPVNAALADSYINVLARLTEQVDPRVQRLLSHCASVFPEERVAKWICDYLDGVMRARKSISDPIDGSGVALLNGMLSQLSPKAQLICLEKALDHLCLLFEHPTAMQPWLEEMQRILTELETTHFCKVPDGSTVNNPELVAWLKSRQPNSDEPEISPSRLFHVFIQHGITFLSQAYQVKPSHASLSLWTKLQESFEQKGREIDQKFPLLKIGMTREQNQNLSFNISRMLIAKCFKKTPKAPWAREFLMTTLWYRMEIFIQDHSKRHQEWILLFKDYVFCPAAFESEELTSKHFHDAKTLVKALQKPADILKQHGKIRFALECFLNYRVVPEKEADTLELQLAEVKKLLDLVWKTPALRGSYRTLYFVHFACVHLLIKDRTALIFKKWYGQLFDEMKGRKGASFDAVNLACHLLTDLQERAGHECLRQMHGKIWPQLADHFAQITREAASFSNGKEDDCLVYVAKSAWEYLSAVKKKLNVKSQEVDKEEARLLGLMEAGLEARCEHPFMRSSPRTLQLIHFLHPLLNSDPEKRSRRYNLILDRIKDPQEYSWGMFDLTSSVAKDFEKASEIHHIRWGDVVDGFIALLERGPAPENASEFDSHCQYFTTALDYVKRVQAQFRVEKKQGQYETAKEKLHAAYCASYSRIFGEIVSSRHISWRAANLLFKLSHDLEKRGKDLASVQQAHRLHWGQIVDAFLFFIASEESPELIAECDENKLDLYYVAMMYLQDAKQRFMTPENRQDFATQQLKVLSTMPIFHQAFMKAVQVHRNSPVNLIEGEVEQCVQLCRIGDSLLEEVKGQSFKLLGSIWKDVVAYLNDRLKVVPIHPVASKRIHLSTVVNAVLVQTSKMEYDPWLCTMSFLNAGREYYALNNQLEAYFEAIALISQTLFRRRLDSPEDYIYLFKMLTDDFPNPEHQMACRTIRAALMSTVIRKIAESDSMYGAAVAVIFLKRKQYLQKIFQGLTDVFTLSQDLFSQFEKRAPDSLIGQLEKVDLSNVTPDTKVMVHEK